MYPYSTTHTHTHIEHTCLCNTCSCRNHSDSSSSRLYISKSARYLPYLGKSHTHTHTHTKKVCFKVLNISLCAQGPLPAFSAEHSWSSPRTVTLSRVEGELGFSIRGAKPVTVSGVDKDSQAEVSSNHLQIDHVVLLSVCSFPGHINGAWE